ncbi:MAG TPA: BatA domain-containing protein [Anaeromyxobacteraceae bacterium]|nr:BatA domain-containing protein [Anaeromyxobacteraceae bacterium]
MTVSLSFIHPALAFGLLAALVPLAIHLFFRRRPRPTPFPAIDFILRARRETERRLRLKKLLLFAARTLLVAAVAAALARPRLKGPEEASAAVARGPSAVALVLDASASMGYRLRGTTLFERGRADALEALAALSGEEPATALVCGGPAAPAAPPPSFDKVAVRRILSEAELTEGYADMSACVAAAVRALSEPGSGASLGKRVVVATDLTASAWRLDQPPPMVETASGPMRPEVTLLDAARGADLPNLAVTELAVEPDASVGSRGYRVRVTVVARDGKSRSGAGGRRGAGDRDLELQLHAGPPSAPVVMRSYAQLAADGAVKKVLAYRFPNGGPQALALSLVPGDALEEDDARVVTVDVPRDVRALVVNGAPSPVRYRDEAFFVEAALSSPASPVRATVLDAESLGKARFSDYDVVFLLDVRSLGAKTGELREFVEHGGGLFIALGDEVDPERYDAELGPLLPRPLHVVKSAGEPGAAARPARFADIDWSHPALDVFNGPSREGFLGVRTFKYMLLKPGEENGKGKDRVLVSYDDGAPALVEARRGQGRVMLYTSTVDRSWSDWAIRTSFLPAVQRMAAFLAGGLETDRNLPSVVNAPRRVAVPEAEKLVAVVGPDGKERPASTLSREADGAVPTVVPDRPGLWQVKVEERGQTRLDPHLAFAVLPDPRESDTTRLDPRELTAYFGGETHARVASADKVGERAVPLWSILLALGLAAFVAEGLLLG